MMGMKKRMKRGGSALKGKQSKLDKNKDGKITGADFKMMKKKKKKKRKGFSEGSGPHGDPVKTKTPKSKTFGDPERRTRVREIAREKVVRAKARGGGSMMKKRMKRGGRAR